MSFSRLPPKQHLHAFQFQNLIFWFQVPFKPITGNLPDGPLMNSKVIQAIRVGVLTVIMMFFFPFSKLELKKQFTKAKHGMRILLAHNTNTFSESLQGCSAGIRHTMSAAHREISSVQSHIIALYNCLQRAKCIICRAWTCQNGPRGIRAQLHTVMRMDLELIVIVTCGL